MPTLRTARPGDAKALAELAEATFRAAFGATNAREHMDLHCRDRFGESIQAAEIADPGLVTLLAEHEGHLVGYAQLRWDPAPHCVAGMRPGEIQRIYVVGQWHGRGVAQALISACVEEMERRGSDAVWLGVWEHNPKAIAFYRKQGFIEVGEHVFSLGGDPQRDVIMARTLASGG